MAGFKTPLEAAFLLFIVGMLALAWLSAHGHRNPKINSKPACACCYSHQVARP